MQYDITSSARILRPVLCSPIQASPQMIVCPFGGASYSTFRSWQALIELDISVSLVIYPGRDHRIQEGCIGNIQRMAHQLADALCAQPPRNKWVLAGHSMGAQIAFETCRLLEQRDQAPAGLVLSACHAPHLGPRRRLSHLNDDDFVEQLFRVGGCPSELRTDTEFRAFFLPMLRSDFIASERYHRVLDEHTSRLNTPALLLYGTSDEEVHRDEVEAWREWLSSHNELHSMVGNHFYIIQRPCTFVSHVSRTFAFS